MIDIIYNDTTTVEYTTYYIWVKVSRSLDHKLTIIYLLRDKLIWSNIFIKAAIMIKRRES